MFIDFAVFQQLAVSTDTRYFSLVKNNYLLRVEDSADTLCNDNHRGVRDLLIQSLAESRVRLVVQGGKAVVKNVDFRLFRDRTRY